MSILDDEKWWCLDQQSGKVVTELKSKDGVVLPDAPMPTVLSDDGLRSYTADGKKEQWRLKAKLSDEGVENSFHYGKTLVMPTKDQGIIGINLENGEILWRIDAQTVGSAIPTPDRKYMLISEGKQIRLVDIAGKLGN